MARSRDRARKSPSWIGQTVFLHLSKLTHSGLRVFRWRNTHHETRRLLYRYCPEHVNFHGGTFQYEQPAWVDELSLSQQSALEPAYRYNRVVVQNDGSVTARPQNASFGRLAEKVMLAEGGEPPVQSRVRGHLSTTLHLPFLVCVHCLPVPKSVHRPQNSGGRRWSGRSRRRACRQIGLITEGSLLQAGGKSAATRTAWWSLLGRSRRKRSERRRVQSWFALFVPVLPRCAP